APLRLAVAGAVRGGADCSRPTRPGSIAALAATEGVSDTYAAPGLRGRAPLRRVRALGRRTRPRPAPGLRGRAPLRRQQVQLLHRPAVAAPGLRGRAPLRQGAVSRCSLGLAETAPGLRGRAPLRPPRVVRGGL